jgi:hypothetical protein
MYNGILGYSLVAIVGIYRGMEYLGYFFSNSDMQFINMHMRNLC